MYNHEPKDYKCPFCGIVSGSNDQSTKQSDVFYKDEFVTAYIAPKWWPHNSGHVIIIPNQHVENIYNISDDLLSRISVMSKKAAIAFKEIYKCDGTSTRQHNEPAGQQDIFHFHTHVFPRYSNDKLYQLTDSFRWTQPDERKEYADKLKKNIQGISI